MQSSPFTSQTGQPIDPNSHNQTNAVGNTLTGILVIVLPFCIVLGAVLYKRHRAYRAAVLFQQIQALERMWRISPRK
jgi:hypothetical protein